MKFNKVITGMDRSGSFRVYMGITTGLVEEARELHHTSPLATHILGRALTGTALMGLMLREPGFKITLQFKGDGPAEQVLCTAGSDGNVKGYIVNPAVDLPPKADGTPDVGGALGIGTLTCIRDAGLKEPYVGKIDLSTGEIADDLTYYFFISEQKETSVSLGVKLAEDGSVRAAGGMIIQMLPGASDECISALEAWLPKMPKISDLADRVTAPYTAGISENPETGTQSTVGSADCAASEPDPETTRRVMEEYLKTAFLGMPDEFAVETLELLNTGWKCDCSEERLEQVVLSIGAREIAKIIEEDGQAELTCQFCGTAYHFDREHLERLLLESLGRQV